MALTDTQKQNRRRFLDYIGWSEGADYGTIVGNKQRFSDYSKHPKIVGLTTAEGDSTAAGRYQITGSTYDDLRKRFKYPEDFGPAAQDELALRLIQDKKALGDVDTGNWRGAINKLGSTWASFPSSPYSQPKRSWSEAMSFFGGTLGSPSGVGETPNTMATDNMLMEMYRQALAQADELEKQSSEQEGQLKTDYASAEQGVNAADEASRAEIMRQPVQAEWGPGQRAIGALLGGATNKGMREDEDTRRAQLQKQHEDLTELAITRTKRLADAYYKMGDIVNAVKYTSAAHKASEKRKEAADLLHQAASISGQKEVAGIYAGGRNAAAAAKITPIMMPDEYSKALNDAISKYKDKKGKLPDVKDLAGLKSEIANMRNTGQTPLSWVKNLYFGIIPPGDRTWWGLMPGSKGLFDINSGADQQQVETGLEGLFSQTELGDTTTGVAAAKKWLQERRGGAVDTEGATQGAATASSTANVTTLKKKAAEIAHLLARAREAVAGGEDAKIWADDIKMYGKQLSAIAAALKEFGVTLGPEDLEVGGTEVSGKRPSYFPLGNQ